VTVEACAVKFVVVRDNMDEGVAAGGAFLSLCARSDHPAIILSLHTCRCTALGVILQPLHLSPLSRL
jgi:hypothetical protein